MKFSLSVRWLVALLLMLGATAARAQTPEGTIVSRRPADEADLRIFVLTMGPGAEPWEKFGHNAIRVIDPSAPPKERDLAYNWGYFDFDQNNFYVGFIQGRMEYKMADDPAVPMMDYYAHDLNRSVWQQELNLTVDQKQKLVAALRWTDTDAHRFYRYDYYRDNCSTRVRDVLDGLIGGQLAAMTKPIDSDTSFRWHTRRLSAESPWLYTLLQAALGKRVDRHISRWDEMFLPEKLRDRLREVMVPDPTGDARLVPLVKNESEYYRSTRPASPLTPPLMAPGFLLVGILFSGVLLGLGHFARRHWVARTAFVLVSLPWLLLMGLGGTFLLWCWFFTDHVVSARNENVLHVSVLMLPIIVLLPTLAFGRRRGAEVARWCTVGAIGLAAAGLLLKVLPWFRQVNWDIIALTMPINLAIAFITWKFADRVRPPAVALETQGQETPSQKELPPQPSRKSGKVRPKKRAAAK